MERINNIDTEAALKAVHSKIRRNKARRQLKALALVLIVPLCVGLGYVASMLNSSQDIQMIEIKSHPGMTAKVTLPDSSVVWLNSNSTLRYPSKFGKSREVELLGEAYFKVAKDVEHKFYVHTSDMKIEVVGTEFNVDAYNISNRAIRTTLVNGAINMHYVDETNTESVLKLYPGQCADLQRGTHKLNVTKINPSTVSSWRNGKIYLDHTMLTDVLRQIENRFNVQFVIDDPKLLSKSFSGQLTNQSLEVMLDFFTKSSGLKFTREDTQYSLDAQIIRVSASSQ